MSLTKPLHNVDHFLTVHRNDNPLFIVDYQVICYTILAKSEAEDGNTALQSRMVAYLNSLPNQLLKEVWPTATTVVVNDYKQPLEDFQDEEGNPLVGYWRHKYYPAYKGGRSVKPPLFFDIRDLGLSYVLSPKNDIHYLEYKGFEADDIAGAFVKAKRHAQLALRYNTFDNQAHKDKLTRIANRPIILITVDKDWLQLVGEGVLWVDTGKYNPPVAYELEAVQWAFRRHKWTIEHPYDIVEMKSIYGDTSDNLPPNCDPALIDLSNPPKEYCLYSKHSKVFEDLLDTYDSYRNTNHLQQAIGYLIKNGLEVVL